MKKLTCCFTGHRVIYKEDAETIERDLAYVIEALIKQGIIYFGVGGALGFDMYAAETVLKLRENYPGVRLVLVLPCVDYDKLWTDTQKQRYIEIKKRADKVIFIEEKYHPGCMQKRNRHLVDHSSVCVAYMRKNSGGTAYTVNYAHKKGLQIINV